MQTFDEIFSEGRKFVFVQISFSQHILVAFKIFPFKHGGGLFHPFVDSFLECLEFNPVWLGKGVEVIVHMLFRWFKNSNETVDVLLVAVAELPNIVLISVVLVKYEFRYHVALVATLVLVG